MSACLVASIVVAVVYGWLGYALVRARREVGKARQALQDHAESVVRAREALVRAQKEFTDAQQVRRQSASVVSVALSYAAKAKN